MTWEQRVVELEEALLRERERSAVWQRRCELLEAARAITARVLASGCRPADTWTPRSVKSTAQSWRDYSVRPRRHEDPHSPPQSGQGR